MKRPVYVVGSPAKSPQISVREPRANSRAPKVSELAVIQERPARVQQTASAIDRLRALIDRNHDGEILDDLERMGRFSLFLLRLASKFVPDHTIVGRAADSAQHLVDRVGAELGSGPGSRS